MNNWNFTGNLGKPAETRHTSSGDVVVQFSVAVKSGYGKNEKTLWANCSIWGKRGESVAPYLTKGQQVAISGEVSLREYEKDGQTRQTLDVRVNDLTLIGKRGEQDERPAKQESVQDDFDDTIPF